MAGTDVVQGRKPFTVVSDYQYSAMVAHPAKLVLGELAHRLVPQEGLRAYPSSVLRSKPTHWIPVILWMWSKAWKAGGLHFISFTRALRRPSLQRM